MTVMRAPLAAALLGSVACASMQPVSDPALFIPQANPHVVYVTYTTGAMVGITQPRVSGDSLFGTLQGLSYQVAMPLSRVELMEAVQRDRTRTAWLIAGLAVATASGVWALSQTGAGRSCDNALPEDTYRHPGAIC
jgi:hypothetical protein